jgi:hypothetical protein
MSSVGVQQNSSLSTPFQISVEKLTQQQAQVAVALAQGRSITKAAAAAGVHRTTVHHWNRTSADFRDAVKLARQEFLAVLDDQLRDLSSAALDTLTTLLTSPETSSPVRLKAALAVLERPHFPDPGWQLPEPVCSTREREVLEGLAEVRRDLMTKGEM